MCHRKKHVKMCQLSSYSSLAIRYILPLQIHLPVLLSFSIQKSENNPLSIIIGSFYHKIVFYSTIFGVSFTKFSHIRNGILVKKRRGSFSPAPHIYLCPCFFHNFYSCPLYKVISFFRYAYLSFDWSSDMANSLFAFSGLERLKEL